MTTTDLLHLNAAAGHLQLGDAMDAWDETSRLEVQPPRHAARTLFFNYTYYLLPRIAAEAITRPAPKARKAHPHCI